MPKGRYQKTRGSTIAIWILSSLLIVSLLFVLFIWHWELKIENSSNIAVIEYGQSLQLPKAYVKGKILFRDGFEVDVIETQKADTTKIGTHINVYESEWLFYKTELSQTVTVVDKDKPTITLKYEENHYTLPGHEYVEEGYSAYDQYDGDITDKVLVFKESGTITYFVQDSSGNYEIVKREIEYKDIEPPIIQLNGEKEMTIYQNFPYEDMGASAIDECEGDLTDNIVVSGRVDVRNTGTYELKYSVSDSMGNCSEESRIVRVVKKPVETNKNGIGKGKTIYLTFDDGPSPYTKQLLDILDKYDIQATFFVVGKSDCIDMIKDIVDRGHSIGIHTVTHNYSKIYSSVDSFTDELYDMQKLILNKTGVETFLMRFPGGSSNTVSKKCCPGIMTTLSKTVEELGFVYFDWNVGSGDTDGLETSEEVFEQTIHGIKNQKNSIVLQHDTKDYSVLAVEEIIKWGLENGYTFAPLDMNSPTAHHPIAN